jgi:hypothetical protein
MNSNPHQDDNQVLEKCMEKKGKWGKGEIEGMDRLEGRKLSFLSYNTGIRGPIGS